MLQRLMDLLNPQTPKEKERALEARAKRIEELAEAAEKEAALRERIAKANKRIKSVQPPRSKWIPVFGVIGFILILILIAQMC